LNNGFAVDPKGEPLAANNRMGFRLPESKKPARRLVSLNSGARTRTNAEGV